MRFSAFIPILLATLVSAQDTYPAADRTTVSTYTFTKTVQRVVQTVTSTRDSSLATVATPLSTASIGVIPQNNGTSTVLGTGAGPSGAVPTGESISGIDRVSFEMLGLMAVAGVVGLAGL